MYNQLQMMKIALGIGNSLQPIISPNSLIEIEFTNISRKMGELLVYTQKQKYIAHLCLFKKTVEGLQWYFLKGNSILEVDGWIPEYRIIGRISTVNGISISTFKWKIKIGYFWVLETLRYGAFRILLTTTLGNLIGRNYTKGYFSRGFEKLTSRI